MARQIESNKHILLIRQDSNAQVGRSDEFVDNGEPKESCIRTFGLDRRDEKGE
jgi:hypothetical protein